MRNAEPKCFSLHMKTMIQNVYRYRDTLLLFSLFPWVYKSSFNFSISFRRANISKRRNTFLCLKKWFIFSKTVSSSIEAPIASTISLHKNSLVFIIIVVRLSLKIITVMKVKFGLDVHFSHKPFFSVSWRTSKSSFCARVSWLHLSFYSTIIPHTLLAGKQ